MNDNYQTNQGPTDTTESAGPSPFADTHETTESTPPPAKPLDDILERLAMVINELVSWIRAQEESEVPTSTSR